MFFKMAAFFPEFALRDIIYRPFVGGICRTSLPAVALRQLIGTCLPYGLQTPSLFLPEFWSHNKGDEQCGGNHYEEHGDLDRQENAETGMKEHMPVRHTGY